MGYVGGGGGGGEVGTLGMTQRIVRRSSSASRGNGDTSQRSKRTDLGIAPDDVHLISHYL